MRLIENLTNPGKPPVDGDRVVLGSGNLRVTKVHHEPPQDEPEPSYQTEFSPEQLLGAFTTEEAFLAASSTVPEVQLQLKVLSFKRPVRIYASDPGYQSAINMLHDNGILTTERRDTLLRGLP